MLSLTSQSDYWNNFKHEMVFFLKNEIPRSQIQSKELNNFLSKIDEIEQKVTEINDLFKSIEQKYILLFSLKDFRNLFKDKDFKKEMLQYISYKEKSES